MRTIAASILTMLLPVLTGQMVVNPYVFDSGGGSTLRTGLVAWWSFDEASGDALDEHDTHDGTENGTGGVARASGLHGNAADFERDDGDYFSVTDHADFVQGGTNPFSINFWTYLETVSNGSPWFSQDTTFPYAFLFRIESGNDAQLYMPTFTANGLIVSSSNEIVTGSWIMVTASYNGTNLKLFINGVLRAISSPTGSWTDSSNAMLIGRHNTLYIDGLIDEMAYWNKALSDGGVTTVGNTATGEVAELYNSGSGISYADTAP